MIIRTVPYDPTAEIEVVVSHEPGLCRDWFSFLWRPKYDDAVEYRLTASQVDAMIGALTELRATAIRSTLGQAFG